MYCIECGVQILESSKFCSHCGHKQEIVEASIKENIADVIIKKEITRQIVEADKSSIDYQFLRKSMGFYLAWALLHLGLLLIGSEGVFDGSNMGSDHFWPFNWKSRVSEYDITEFLVYTIFPIAILFVISMTQSDENDESTFSENNDRSKEELNPMVENVKSSNNSSIHSPDSKFRYYTLKTNYGFLKIKTQQRSGYTMGDEVFLNEKPAPNGKYIYGRPSWLCFIKIEDGKIKQY